MARPLEKPEASGAPTPTWFRDRLSLEECLAMLSRCRMGRVGAIVNGRPVIVPAAYVSDGVSLLVRIDGNLLDEALHRVSFEIEATDSRSGTGWCVVVQGVAQEVTHVQVGTEAEGPGAAEAGRPKRWIRIRPGHVIGRRLPDLDDDIADPSGDFEAA